MKKLFVNFLAYTCVIAALLIVAGYSYPLLAQVGPGGGGNPCPGGEPCDPEVPIAGIEWLLLAGGLFGFRGIYKKFRKA